MKAAFATSRKSLSAEEILSETCTDILSDDTSETEDDDVDNEGDSNCEPEIIRKLIKMCDVCQ